MKRESPVRRTTGTMTRKGLIPHLKARGIEMPVALMCQFRDFGMAEVITDDNGLPSPVMHYGQFMYVMPGGRHVTAAQAKGEAQIISEVFA